VPASLAGRYGALVEQIPIVYIEGSERVDGEKGIFSAARQASARVGAVAADELAAHLSSVCRQLSATFNAVQRSSDAFDLDSFEVTLDIAASGEVRLIGSVSAEMRGGLKLTFTRRPAQ
jgi:hypothetical protein